MATRNALQVTLPKKLKTVHKHGGCAKETFEVADGNQCLLAVLLGVAIRL